MKLVPGNVYKYNDYYYLLLNHKEKSRIAIVCLLSKKYDKKESLDRIRINLKTINQQLYFKTENIRVIETIKLKNIIEKVNIEDYLIDFINKKDGYIWKALF